jgi:hypothetical protein
MAEDVATTAAGMAAAVTGSDTPSNVKVSRPTAGAVWTLFAGLVFVAVVAMAIGAALTFAPWPEVTAGRRVWFLGWALIVSVICIPLFAFALASPWVGRVEASAGANHVSLEGRP